MPRALVIGGTRFIGRHLVTELQRSDYDVTLFNRGRHENPFDDVPRFTGDRTSGAKLARAAKEVEPSVVVDCVAYHPGEVREATRAFSDVDAYVYVSSGAVYRPDVVPKREKETPLEPCTDAEAVDDSPATYGARKAAGDRAVFEAAENGVNAMSVRPTIVYGRDDYTGRFHYWVDQIRSRDRVLVPGDGTNIHHLVAVENVARAIRTVAENGTPGEAYNVGDRSVLPLGRLLETIAAALDRDVAFVPASAREMRESAGAAGIQPADFPLYNPDTHILSTEKLASVGWDPLAPDAAIDRAVAWRGSPDRDPGPDQAAVERVLAGLTN